MRWSGGAAAFPGVYTVAFAQSAAAPTFAESEEGAAFLEQLKEYANYPDVPAFPHCVWSYQIGATPRARRAASRRAAKSSKNTPT